MIFIKGKQHGRGGEDHFLHPLKHHRYDCRFVKSGTKTKVYLMLAFIGTYGTYLFPIFFIEYVLRDDSIYLNRYLQSGLT